MENKNFRIEKYDGDRNQKNSHFCNTLNCLLNYRENNTEAQKSRLVISKRLKFPYAERTDTQIFIAPLRMQYSAWIAQKVFSFNVFIGGNRRWVPLYKEPLWNIFIKFPL